MVRASDSIPGAPWRSTVDALLWLHPATADARGVLPQGLAPGPGITIGGLIAYRDGPVGPYNEVFGAPVMVRGAALLSHVAFMAVDSQRSVAGGRRNWALPKVLASFEGDPGRPGRVAASGDGWALSVTTAARARRFPFVASFRCAQLWPDGEQREFLVRMRGRARLARAAVRHVADSALRGWLADGDHLAVLISGRQDVSAPRLAPPVQAPDAGAATAPEAGGARPS
jgi:hypothetical protein